MIVVTGATGVLNGHTIEHLLRRLPPEGIGVSVRSPERAQHLADSGVAWAALRNGFYADLGQLLGRRIERSVVDDDEWVAAEIARGIPEPVARLALSMFQATRTGHFAHRDPTLERLLGRKPRGIADQLADQLGA